MFHFQPTRVSSFPADLGYSRPQPSRQRYLDSLAELRAAEAEREEEDLLRRLEEIQLRKQHDHLLRRSQHDVFSPYSYRSFDEEELERTAAVRHRQQELELEYIRRKREEEAQLLAVTQKREELKLQELTRLRQEEEARLRALRHEAQQFEAVHRTRSLQGLPSSKQVLPRSDSDVLISLNQLFGNQACPVAKPKQNKPQCKAAPCSSNSNPKSPASLEDLFSGFIQHLHRPQAEQKPATEEKLKQAPRASLPSPQTLEEVLRLMFNPQPLVSSDAKKVATKPVAQAPEPKEKPQVVDSSSRPVSTLSLKEQLEARLHNDESVEIQDTIQALLASLSDSHASATTSVPDASNHKGKGKASEPRPGPSTPSDALKALEAVQNIEASFIALQDDFEFPDDVDFSPTSSRSSSPSRDDSASNAESDTATIRKLGYTARNHPIRFYEQSLSRLLVQLDEIESNGNAELRVRRKAVVALVEGALEELEKKVEVRWIRWNKSHVRADREEDSEPSRNVEVADSEVPAETVSGTTATAESAVASSFPLTAIEVESSDVDTSSPTTGEVVEEVTVDETDLSLNATNAVEDSFEAPSQPETEDDIANTDTNSLSVNLPLRVSTYASTIDAPASLSSPVISESVSTIRPSDVKASNHTERKEEASHNNSSESDENSDEESETDGVDTFSSAALEKLERDLEDTGSDWSEVEA